MRIDFTFDPERHLYLVEGRPVPSFSENWSPWWTTAGKMLDTFPVRWANAMKPRYPIRSWHFRMLLAFLSRRGTK